MNHRRRGRGVLIPIGGAEDRGEKKSPLLPFEEKGVLKHVLDEARGKDTKLVLVTSASRIPDELAGLYRHAFNRLGCREFKHIHITGKRQCRDEELLNSFRSADAIMFSGGNQSRLPRAISRTPLYDLLMDRYENDGLVMAGTSAGAMAMAQFMIAGGSASEAFLKGAVHLNKGFGFSPDIIIDTHFVRRGRFGRLAEAVAINPNVLGIGLAENTGVIIKNGAFTVIGSGMVIVMDPRNLTHNNHDILDDGTPMTMTGLTTHFLANGDTFSLTERTAHALPLDSTFI